MNIPENSLQQNTSSDRILLENVIEKSVQFRDNIRDITRRKRSPTEQDNTKKLLLDQCDDYRSQLKYLGVEIKVNQKILSLFSNETTKFLF